MDDPKKVDHREIDDDELTKVRGGRAKGFGVELAKMWLNESSKRRLTPSDTSFL